MRLRIETYEHGEPGMWRAIGPAATSRAAIKDLGGPIYSSSGMLWIVAFDGKSDDVVGFVSLRQTDGAVWYDYAFVDEKHRAQGVFRELADERDKIAAASKLPQRSVIRAVRWPRYKVRGWKKLRVNSQWLHIERPA